jgi:hypothetical protein
MRFAALLLLVACGPQPAPEAPPPAVSAPITTVRPAPAQLPAPPVQGTVGTSDDCSNEAAARCSQNGGHCRLVANNGCAGRGAVCQNVSTGVGCVCHCPEVGPGGEVYLPM